MDTPRRTKIGELFAQAAGIAPADRAAFLEGACGSNAELLYEVERLLDIHTRPSSSLDTAITSSETFTPSTLTPGDIVADRFRIDNLVGAGGMGVVYRAYDLKLATSVALKMLRPEIVSDPRAAERFMAEVRLARLVTHPNVCRIYDFGTGYIQGREIPFLTMEFVWGTPLSEILRSQGRLPETRALEFLRQIASALDACHEAGIVHGDLKPGNVLIAVAQGGARAVVTDFGLSHAIDPGDEQTASVIAGTPAYMSPEQFGGARPSIRSDIYSLGVLALELVADQRVNVAASDKEKQRQIDACRLSSNWKWALRKALAHDPGARFRSAGAFVEALAGAAPTFRVLVWAIAFGAVLVTLWLAWNLPTLEALVIRIVAMVATVALIVVAARYLRRSGAPGQIRREPSVAVEREVLAEDNRQKPPSSDDATEAFKSSGSQERGPEGSGVEFSARRGGPPTGFTQFLPGDGYDELPKAAIVVTSCPDPLVMGQVAQIKSVPFPLGRGQNGFAVASDSTISREHALITWNGRSFYLRDLGSDNGTFLDGRRLTPARDELLWLGAEIRLSRSTQLRFTVEVSELPDLTGQILAGRYTLIKPIRVSRKIALYEAADTRPPRQVAVKLLSPTLASYAGYLEMFEREAHTAAGLSHPNICKIFEYGRASLRFGPSKGDQLVNYICMPLLDGGSLTDRIDCAKYTDALAVAAWLEIVAEALEYAHRNGVVHGGLKPSSIVFGSSDEPHVTDFAIATRPSDGTRRPLLGHPDYLAPEQWAGFESTPETDQYSLAVLAFRTLTGRVPYEGQREPETRNRNFASGPPSAESVAQTNARSPVTPDVTRVLQRALSMGPKDRYSSIREFALAFRRALQSSSSGVGLQKIFISYRREPSSGWAVLIARVLKEQYSIEAFVDTQRVDSTVEIPVKIKDAIRECDVFVCLLARLTLNSDWVLEEIKLAAAAGKPMIPLFHEGFRRPRRGSVPDYVEKLFNYEGVRVYADYDDAAIAKLAKIVGSCR